LLFFVVVRIGTLAGVGDAMMIDLPGECGFCWCSGVGLRCRWLRAVTKARIALVVSVPQERAPTQE